MPSENENNSEISWKIHEKYENHYIWCLDVQMCLDPPPLPPVQKSPFSTNPPLPHLPGRPLWKTPKETTASLCLDPYQSSHSAASASAPASKGTTAPYKPPSKPQSLPKSGMLLLS
jgi:hypothetical protein